MWLDRLRRRRAPRASVGKEKGRRTERVTGVPKAYSGVNRRKKRSRSKRLSREPRMAFRGAAPPLRLQRARADDRRRDDAYCITNKHHQAYVTGREQGARGHRTGPDRPVEDVLPKTSARSRTKKRNAVRNNAGGHYNHSLFWEWMSPDGGGAPEGELGLGDRCGVRLA